MRITSEQLQAFLLDAGLATKNQLTKAQKESEKTGKKIGDVLIAQNVLKKDELIKMEAYVLGIPFVNLEKEAVLPEILQIIPEALAKKNNIVSFRKANNSLEVAMLDPEDLQTIEFIAKKSNLKILPRLTSEASLKHILDQYRKPLTAEFEELIEKNETKDIELIPGKDELKAALPEADLKKAAEELPIIKIVDTLLKHAILQKASDIHIEPMEKEIIVRYRVDGLLHDVMTLPGQIGASIVARIKVLSNLKIDEHRLPQDGRFKIETEGQKVSLRVSILPIYDGEKIVMRLLPEDAKGYTLEAIGFHGKALEIIQKDIRKPHGLILVTGPTGCGKTTTLYTIMDILNDAEVNICTVEDPIEYRMPRINQTQVQPKIGLTFANGLRALVRQDPDIIMVGEIRDNETAALAINAALTGHLVLSTLHTNSAAGSLPRLIDMQVEPFLIASTTNCLIAQRLVRRFCLDAREKYLLSAAEIKSLTEKIDMDRVLKILHEEKIIPPKADWPDIDFYHPKASADCPDGYKGRLGIFEVLEITNDIKDMVVKHATADEIEAQAKKEGMITMLEDGLIKAAQGITSIEEVLGAAQE